MSAAIHILHVDDEPEFADLAATYLEREDSRFTVETTTSATDGLSRITDETDCVVSDYEMPGMSGIEFLETVRAEYPDLPFILFTGKGSEEVASDAISADVTDYLQKEGGTDQYTVLAHRISNAVERHAAERERRQWKRAVETASEGIAILDDDGRYLQMNEAYAQTYGMTPGELLGETPHAVYPDDVAEWFEEDVRPTVQREGTWEGEAVGCRADGTQVEQQLSLAKLEDGGHVCVMNDITERKERARELKRYETIVEASNDPVVALDADGEITFVNDALVELTGHECEYFIGNDPSGLVDPEDIEQGEQVIQTLLSSDAEHDTFEVTLTTADGERIPCESYVALLPFDEQFQGTVWMFRNIAGRTEREAQLRQEQQRFQTLFEQLSQPLVEVEYDGLDPIVTDVNPAFEETFGYDASAITGESLDAYIVPDDRRDEAEDINQYVRGGGRLVSREVARQTTDGVRDFLLENAVYEDGSGGFAIYTEITDRKRREEALEALHEATREFMDATNKQVVAEQAVETARTVLDQPITGLWLYEPDDEILAPIAMTADAHELLGEQPVYAGSESLSWQAYMEGELRVYDDVRTETTRLNDETLIRSEIIVPLGDHGVMNLGATTPATFTEIDISLARILGQTVAAALERADRERQLRTQRAELERQNERLDEFVSVVSHDVRNPMSVATARLEFAREDCDSVHLAKIENALDRIDTLTDDLLTLAREGKAVGETEPVELADASTNSWQNIITDTATLVTDTRQTIRADPNRLKQLLENLMQNAVEHGNEDVTVTIGDLDGGFYVADDGPGIPEDERDRLFKSGYSTSAAGTGFGLAIVEEIAEAHGWDVRVSTSDDGGARFEITAVDVVD